VSNASLQEGNYVAALWLSRFSQGSGVETLAERCLAQVMGCAAKTCSLFHSLLIKQTLDLTLQPRNSTLATVSPVLKGLSLWERSGGWQSSIICTHQMVPSDQKQSRRTLRLNRGH
jgi:hypothetical protein